MRALLGTIGGALFCSIVAVALIGLLLAMPLVVGNLTPMDRERDLEHLGNSCAHASVCGLIVGALAGFASRYPKHGVPFLRCCLLITIPAGLVRFLTAPRPRSVDTSNGIRHAKA